MLKIKRNLKKFQKCLKHSQKKLTETKIIFCNGKFLPEHEPCIPLTDRGFLFGDGIFTTIKVVNGKAEYLDDHITRCYEQCIMLGIIPPVISTEAVIKLVKKNQATTGIWRLKIIITGGNGHRLCLEQREFGKLLMMLGKVEESFPHLINLTLYEHTISSPHSRLKTLSYLSRLYVADYAKTRGFDDAIVLSCEGFIMETAFSNIFWVVGQEVFVPCSGLDLLLGITILKQIDEYRLKGYKVSFVKAKVEDIPSNAQIYICNSIRGVVPAKFPYGYKSIVQSL
jgi:4-amino-4-deoxychorismate lyase